MPRDEREDFKEMELWEHLAELRGRLVRSITYAVVGLVLAWVLYPWLQKLLFAPLLPFLQSKHYQLVFRTFTGPFMLQLQVSAVAGLVLAIPLVTLEVWGFVAPGLTRTERKACYLIFPLAILFFFLGIGCGYVIMGPSVGWFMDFFNNDPTGSVLQQDPSMYLTFMIKMVVAFGVCFQLPLVLMFLAYIGVVSSKMLLKYWRHGVVGCAVVAAVATPGGDPFSMFVMAVPLMILYMASVILCRLVEAFKANRAENSERQVALDST